MGEGGKVWENIGERRAVLAIKIFIFMIITVGKSATNAQVRNWNRKRNRIAAFGAVPRYVCVSVSVNFGHKITFNFQLLRLAFDEQLPRPRALTHSHTHTQTQTGSDTKATQFQTQATKKSRQISQVTAQRQQLKWWNNSR